jgi:hypothetical protein
MRNLCLFVFVAIALGSPELARAQPFLELVGGEVALAVGATRFGGSCYVNRGNSQFQTNGAESQGLGTKAVISFDEIVDSAIWELRGQAVLTFATATSGTIRFERTSTVPAAIREPAFKNYTQTYQSTTQKLVVSFSIVFPDCTLPVFAVFYAP